MARPSISSPLGKLDAEIKLAIDEQTRDDLAGLAWAAGKTLSEYVRQVLHLHVHGHARMVRARTQDREQDREQGPE